MFDRKEYKKLDGKARWVMIITDITGIFISLAVFAVIYLILSSFTLNRNIFTAFFIVAGMWMTYALFSVIFDPTVGYNTHRYKVTDVSVQKISGILYIETKIVPIRRIQQVELHQGPVLRMFSLANVEVITGGGSMSLEYLEFEEAQNIVEALRDEINEFARLQAAKEEGYTGNIADSGNEEMHHE